MNKFIVLSKKAAEEVDCVICGRIKPGEMPAFHGSIREKCALCKEPIWFDSVNSPHKPEKICLECALTKYCSSYFPA